ncbi:hypothetical protein ACU8NU_37025 (plasmid) [Rhizobium leguminosarum]
MAVINITPNASGQDLRKDLDDAAQKNGVTLRRLVGAIYEYAIDHQSEFSGPLQALKRTPGDHIGTTVSEDVGRKLTTWSKERKVPRGVHCKYVLEKALELKLADKLFSASKK